MTLSADYADEVIDKCPLYLKMAFMCKKWQTLPREGGILDQPLVIMEYMELSLNTFEYFRERLRGMGNVVQWSKENPEMAQFCILVDKLRLNDNN